MKLGCTKSFSAPPLDEAILVALELNPRHANTRRLDFDDSENIKKRKIRKKGSNEVQRVQKNHPKLLVFTAKLAKLLFLIFSSP